MKHGFEVLSNKRVYMHFTLNNYTQYALKDIDLRASIIDTLNISSTENSG